MVLVWLRFISHTYNKNIRYFLSIWFFFIAISVLTCYQHHFIDVPLGFFVGILISYLLPMQSFERISSHDLIKRIKLGSFYLFGSLVLAGPALYFKGGFLWLFWPAFSLLLVALGYFIWGTAIFQKDKNGKISLSSRILLAPYRLGAYLSKLWFTKRLLPHVKITDKIYLGSLPIKNPITQICLMDLTAEFDSSSIICNEKVCYPRMDLLPQSPKHIQEAVEDLITLTEKGTVLVCCSLGLSRSATIVIAYLIANKQFKNIQQAKKFVIQKRPIVLSSKQIYYLQEWQQNYII